MIQERPDKFRLHVVDALRGFAVVSIMLLHNIQHFDLYFVPQGLPVLVIGIDKVVMNIMIFLFGGKSYAIFSLLFGLTFFIQSNNQEKKGNDFRGRFAWRLVLLFLFGVLNSAFYQGDILMYYSVVGFLIIPVAKLSDKVVLGIALFLFLQPLEWVHLFKAIQNPDMALSNRLSWTYFGNMAEYIRGDSFAATVIGNLTNGKKASILWNWENARYFHMLALFMTGMLMGRRQLFAENDENKRFWKKTLLLSSISFMCLFAIKLNLGEYVTSKAIRRPMFTMESSWANISFMFVLVSGFVLLFYSKVGKNILNIFSPIGKMSLSNYVFQSIIGASIYYGYGLGLYQYTGATYCLLIGIVLAILFGVICTWWAKYFKHGPLEGIWHKATWIGSK